MVQIFKMIRYQR